MWDVMGLAVCQVVCHTGSFELDALAGSIGNHPLFAAAGMHGVHVCLLGMYMCAVARWPERCWCVY
jgi:hypothetical protein